MGCDDDVNYVAVTIWPNSNRREWEPNAMLQPESGGNWNWCWTDYMKLLWALYAVLVRAITIIAKKNQFISVFLILVCFEGGANKDNDDCPGCVIVRDRWRSATVEKWVRHTSPVWQEDTAQCGLSKTEMKILRPVRSRLSKFPIQDINVITE